MMQYVEIEETNGKTIKQTCRFLSTVYLVFEDNTYSILNAQLAKHGEDPILSQHEFLYISLMADIGIMTREEADIKHKELMEKAKEEVRKSEISHLKSLRKKYPNIPID